MNDIAIYQHPFADVFLLTKLTTWKTCDKQGEVSEVYDKQLAKNVLKIAGPTPASNYVQVPAMKRLPKNALGLNGKFIYVVLLAQPGKNFVMHFDYTVNDSRTVRLSLSNMYKEFKNKNNLSLQVPLVDVNTGKWSVVAVDAARLLTENKVFEAGRTPKFSMRSFQICAQLQIKGVYTSDIRYAANTLPKGIQLKVTNKEKDWFKEYQWVSLPNWFSDEEGIEADTESEVAISKKENVEDNFDEKKRPATAKIETKSSMKKGGLKKMKSDAKVGNGVQFKSPNKTELNEDLDASGAEAVPLTYEEEMKLHKQKLKLDQEHRKSTAINNTKQALEKTGEQIEEIRREFDCNLQSKNIKANVEVTLYHDSDIYDLKKSAAANSADYLMRPSPILGLDRIVGMHPRFRAQEVFFNRDAKLAHEVIHSQANLILGYHSTLQKQRHFLDTAQNLQTIEKLLVVLGYALVFTRQPSSSKSEQVEVQVTIWDLEETDKALFAFRPPIQQLKHATISADLKHLALNGKDFQGRELILVYAFQELVQHQKVELLGRQLCDFNLTSFKFNEALNTSIIGCGKENIRFFKLKNNFLPGQLVALNNTSRGKVFNNSTVTYQIVQQNQKPATKKPVSVYVSTEDGLVYIVNFFSRQVDKIIQVSDGPIQSLMQYAGTESSQPFFLTCSRDEGNLRLWSSDFAKLVSEVSLNQEVVSCDINVDGNEIAVLGENGTLSLLELDSSSFRVLMRSHADEVIGVACNDVTGTLLTVGKDSSIKVWHAGTMEQIHEFNTSAHDPPTKVASSQVDDLAAVGFKSGFLRVFSMEKRTMVHETMIFQAAVCDIAFDSVSKFMAVFFKTGEIVIFNLQRDFQPVKNIDYEFPNAHYHSLSFSSDGSLLANISSNANTVTIWETKNFSLKYYVDMTGEVISKIQFAPNDRDLLVMTTSAKLKYLRVDQLKNPTDSLDVVRDQYGLADKECTDFCVTANNKWVIVAGQDGLIRVYDYFMRGQIMPQQQSFPGHALFPASFAMQRDMKFMYSVGPRNGIFKWAFWGDKELPEGMLNEYYERTAKDEEAAKAEEKTELTLPTWDDNELKTYTEEQLGKARDNLMQPINTQKAGAGERQDNFPTTLSHKVDRPNKDILADGGLCLKRAPKVEYTPAGYCYEQYEISLSKMLACSTRPKAGNNFAWHEEYHYFAYSVNNILVFEELDQEKTQLLKRETNDVIHEIRLSPNGKLLMAWTKTGPMDGYPQILIFDAKTKKRVNCLTIEDHELVTVEFSKNSNMLLVVSFNNQAGDKERSTLSVWDFMEGRRDYFCKSVVPFKVLSAKWNFYLDQADEFVSITQTKYHYWRIDKNLQMQYQPGKLPAGWTAKQNLTACCYVEPCLDQNSIYLLIGLSDGTVWVLDTRTNYFLYQAKILDSRISKITCTTARIVVEGADDTKVHSWELKKVINDFEYDASDPNYFFSGNDVTLTLDGFPSASHYDDTARQVIFLSTNGSFWLFDFLDKATVKLKSCHIPQHAIGQAIDFKYVTPTQFQPEQKETEELYQFDQNYIIASSGEDGAVKTWNMFDQEQVANFMIPKEKCACLVAHAFKPVLISSFTDGYLRFFDMQASRNMGRCLIRAAEEEGDEQGTPPSYTDYATHLKILPSGTHIMGATKNGQIFLIFVQSWEPLAITIHNIVSLNTSIHSFGVSFLEPYNKWAAGTQNGKVILYNRQDANAFKQELFDERQPPKFSFMDSFNVQEYVDNCFTETKKVNQLDHYYSLSKRNLVHNEVSEENQVEVGMLNNDLASYVCYVRKSPNLFIRNFELHQVVKRIELHARIQQLEMAPGNAPFLYVTCEDNTLNMVDFVNEANRSQVDLIHDSVRSMKVCPNGRYVMTGGDKGDIVVWKVRRQQAPVELQQLL